MVKILYLLVVFFCLNLSAQQIKPYYGPFPEPTPHKNMLFYLQRTIDRNTVIYELNYDLNGVLNLSNPIKVYWIEFENGGKIKSLSFAQNKLAYGIDAKLIDEKNKVFQVNLVSYKKIVLYLRPVGKNKRYQLYTTIKGKPSVLKKIHVNIVGGSYLNPTVSSLEITGNAVKSGALIKERIKAD